MDKIIGASNLMINKIEGDKALKETDTYIRGFYHGYATCKRQAEKEGYHKHPKPQSSPVKKEVKSK